MRTQITLLIFISLLFSISCSAQKTSAENINKIATLEKARAAHTATLLKDGNVLIVGGVQQNETFYNTAELFDSKKNTFTTLKNKMTKKRVSHTATLLEDGRVLIIGGWSNQVSPDNSAEVYDPKTQKFIAVGNMKFKRSGHSSTLLENGKVLIAGGHDGQNSHDEAELFNPKTNSFLPTGKMQIARKIHTATKLNDSRVLITGGDIGNRKIIADAEVYNPKTNQFNKVSAKMNAVRYKHDAVLLADGNVLIFGGSDNRDWSGRLKSAEIFDAQKETFAPTKDMNFARFKIFETATLLPSGNVLIAGGSGEAEIFNAKKKSFERVSGNLGDSLHFSTVTLLKDGRALIIGGYSYQRNAAPKSTNQAWIFKL